jgi:hypothetical protein
MIKSKILLIALLALSLVLPTLAKADHIVVEVGDRPYYTHGARYWDGDWEMVWVPGHWSEHGHHWVHGHYRKGEHHHHHHHDHDDHDDR